VKQLMDNQALTGTNGQPALQALESGEDGQQDRQKTLNPVPNDQSGRTNYTGSTH
jgi:hypothetical protein